MLPILAVGSTETFTTSTECYKYIHWLISQPSVPVGSCDPTCQYWCHLMSLVLSTCNYEFYYCPQLACYNVVQAMLLLLLCMFSLGQLVRVRWCGVVARNVHLFSPVPSLPARSGTVPSGLETTQPPGNTSKCPCPWFCPSMWPDFLLQEVRDCGIPVSHIWKYPV